MTKSDPYESDEEIREYASPACMLHEVDPAYSGISPDESRISDIFAWRKIQRQPYQSVLAIPRRAGSSRMDGDCDGARRGLPVTRGHGKGGPADIPILENRGKA
jgi:hypothetical protein